MMDLTTTTSPIVIGGVDTHKELHVVAVVDAHDVVIGTESFSTTRAGYRALVRWMRTYGDITRVGVERTGSYGAGLVRVDRARPRPHPSGPGGAPGPAPWPPVPSIRPRPPHRLLAGRSSPTRCNHRVWPARRPRPEHPRCGSKTAAE